MDEEKLILLVSFHEEIFNSGNPQYNNLEKKEMCWRRISEELGQPVYKCKDKWANLRGSYRRAIKKRFAANLQGSDPMPLWRFENQMEFLKPFLKPREYLTVKATSDVKHEPDECIYFDSALDYSDSEMVSIGEKISSTTEKGSDGHPGETSCSNISGGENSKKRESNCFAYDESFDSANVTRVSELAEKDVTLEFFVNMANTVKTFPPKLQTEIKFKVFQLVNAAEYSIQQSSSDTTEEMKENQEESTATQSSIKTPPYQNESLNSLNPRAAPSPPYSLNNLT